MSTETVPGAGVACFECRWWDWAVGCAEDREVEDPRAPRHCERFKAQDEPVWRAWPVRIGDESLAGRPRRMDGSS